MDRIEEVKEVKEVKKDEKYPILALRRVWPSGPEIHLALKLIQPYATEICEKSMGEYTFQTIEYELSCGISFLHLGFTVKTEEDKKLVEDETTNYLDVANIEKDFAGYVITRYDPRTPNDVHIWQVYIMPKYQNTNIKHLGMVKLEDRFKSSGVKNITMAAIREGWHEEAPKAGFVETYTIYRKSLEEKEKTILR